jgi:hypothetical protein
MKRPALILCFVLLAAVAVMAQRRWGGWRSYGEGLRTAREVPSNSTGTPTWTNAPGFERDVFTFLRVRYSRGGFGRGGGGWATDLPDSDLNLSFRLQQITAMKVDPDGRILRLTDPDLADFPFIYIVEPGGLYLDPDEVAGLRAYLLNGGFLWLDDFWGEREWENCEAVLREIFPERTPVEMKLDHPLYRCVFPINAKHQIPHVGLGSDSRYHGVTWERHDAQEVHHKAIFDDRGRLMVFLTHNTDNGDGWEREGEDDYYFHQFSEKAAYPLAINVLFYAMTH